MKIPNHIVAMAIAQAQLSRVAINIYKSGGSWATVPINHTKPEKAVLVGRVTHDGQITEFDTERDSTDTSAETNPPL